MKHPMTETEEMEAAREDITLAPVEVVAMALIHDMHQNGLRQKEAKELAAIARDRLIAELRQEFDAGVEIGFDPLCLPRESAA